MKRKPGKKNPTGKLHSRWVNSHEKVDKQIDEEGEENLELLYDDNNLGGFLNIFVKLDVYLGFTVLIFFIETLDNLKCWLANNFEPWSEVCINWEKTASMRIPKFQNSSKPLYELLQEWPRFDDPNGYQLVYVFNIFK